ncbi:MAG: 1-acyl-sn-glycerol-3-phosphate acyltransferase [Deltaproteobacteria bacterium]|nr:1-acyl-sn-glycerol-3-phosphate acyltransferase [Deltaproteobacteria bacterium]
MERRTTTSQANAAAAFASRLDSLTHSMGRAWRVVATAISFATAGLISLFLALVIFPLVRLTRGTGEQREIRSQYAMHWALRFYIAVVIGLGVMRLRVHGAEKLREPGTLVVANHPTLIDALILMSFMPQADCVVKASHYDNFWLGGAVKGAGYVPNRSGPQLVEECAERLRRGRSVLIFPEGTRSPKNELGHFARGAAHIALHAGSDPVPVTIECEPATLYHGVAWWDVPERRFTVTLTVDPPLPIDEVVSLRTSRPRAARAITAKLRDHFERRLALVRDQCTS